MFDNKVHFVMNALFRRRIYKPFGLLRDHLIRERHYYSVNTVKAVLRDCHITLYRPLSVVSHERLSCSSMYCNSRRHLSDDVHSHKYRFESAADGRWSNRCNCCGLNSKGFIDETYILLCKLLISYCKARLSIDSNRNY